MISKYMPYVFGIFLLIALGVFLTGVNITYWTQYEFASIEVTGEWYNIQPFGNSFWSVFRSLNAYFDANPYVLDLPTIPEVPLFPNASGFQIVLNVLIMFVNGLANIINILITIFNQIRSFVNTMVQFIWAFTIWIASAGQGVQPIG